MNISPLDIRKHEFKKSLRGFDTDEVSAYLDMISIEFENLIRENSILTERTASIDSQLKKYRDIESTLQETLLSAQRAREETIKIAKKQADIIIREAEVKAASIVEGGRRELSALRSSFNELKVHKDAYYAKLKALVHSQMDLLEGHDFPEEKLYAATVTEEEPLSRPRQEDSFMKQSIPPKPVEPQRAEKTEENDMLYPPAMDHENRLEKRSNEFEDDALF